MSADNFLALVPNGKKVELHDLGFSHFSSLPEWNEEHDSAHKRHLMAQRVRNGSYRPISTHDNAEAALSAAEAYCSSNIVEYGIVSFIPNVDIRRQIASPARSGDRPHCVVQQEKHRDRIVEDVIGPFPSEEAAKTFVAEFTQRRPDQDQLYHHRIFEMLDPTEH